MEKATADAIEIVAYHHAEIERLRYEANSWQLTFSNPSYDAWAVKKREVELLRYEANSWQLATADAENKLIEATGKIERLQGEVARLLRERNEAIQASMIDMAKAQKLEAQLSEATKPHTDSFLAGARAALEAAANEAERMTMYPGGKQECQVHNNVWSAATAIRATNPEDLVK